MLCFTSRELVRLALEKVCDLHRRGDRRHAASDLVRWPATESEREVQVVPDGDHSVLRSGSFMLPAPESAVASLAHDMTVGIRPEDIRVDPQLDGETTFRARCDLVEYLGHQVLAHLRVGELELLAFDDPSRHLRAGDIVDCTIALDRLHLFDSSTGRSLGRP